MSIHHLLGFGIAVSISATVLADQPERRATVDPYAGYTGSLESATIDAGSPQQLWLMTKRDGQRTAKVIEIPPLRGERASQDAEETLTAKPLGSISALDQPLENIRSANELTEASNVSDYRPSVVPNPHDQVTIICPIVWQGSIAQVNAVDSSTNGMQENDTNREKLAEQEKALTSLQASRNGEPIELYQVPNDPEGTVRFQDANGVEYILHRVDENAAQEQPNPQAELIEPVRHQRIYVDYYRRPASYYYYYPRVYCRPYYSHYRGYGYHHRPYYRYHGRYGHHSGRGHSGFGISYGYSSYGHGRTHWSFRGSYSNHRSNVSVRVRR